MVTAKPATKGCPNARLHQVTFVDDQPLLLQGLTHGGGSGPNRRLLHITLAIGPANAYTERNGPLQVD